MQNYHYVDVVAAINSGSAMTEHYQALSRTTKPLPSAAGHYQALQDITKHWSLWQ